MNCPTCGKHVDYKNLRSERPKCDDGHDLGLWVHCNNTDEQHVYLLRAGAKCPYCSSAESLPMEEGTIVKCLHSSEAGLVCWARPYKWMIEGPPCFLNHVEKMRLQQAVKTMQKEA